MYDVRFMYDLFLCTIYATDNRQSPYTILVYRNRLIDFFGVFSNSCG